MLRVALVTCVIFTSFVCERTKGNAIGDTGVRLDNIKQDEVLQRSRRAAVGGVNGAGGGGQDGQQQFGNAAQAQMAGAGNPAGNPQWQAGQGPMGGMPLNQNFGGGRGPNFQGGAAMNMNPVGQQWPNMPNQNLQNMQNMMMNQNGGNPPQAQFQQPPGQGFGQGEGVNKPPGLGKQRAKDMRNKKAQLAAAMRPLRIAETDICRDDVISLCGKNARGNNFAVLDCLQNARQVSK